MEFFKKHPFCWEKHVENEWFLVCKQIQKKIKSGTKIELHDNKSFKKWEFHTHNIYKFPGWFSHCWLLLHHHIIWYVYIPHLRTCFYLLCLPVPVLVRLAVFFPQQGIPARSTVWRTAPITHMLFLCVIIALLHLVIEMKLSRCLHFTQRGLYVRVFFLGKSTNYRTRRWHFYMHNSKMLWNGFSLCNFNCRTHDPSID